MRSGDWHTTRCGRTMRMTLRDVAAELDRRLQPPVGVAEEVQVGHADGRRGVGLLHPSDARHLGARQLEVASHPRRRR